MVSIGKEVVCQKKEAIAMNKKERKFKNPHSSIKINSSTPENTLIFAETAFGKKINPTVQVEIDLETFDQLTSLIAAQYLGQTTTKRAEQWLVQVAEKLGLSREGDRDE